LYVPEFKRNLISIENLYENKYKVIFYNYNNKNLVSVYDKNKNKIFTIKSNKTKIYKVLIFKNKLKYNNTKKKIGFRNVEEAMLSEDMETWHRRIGHYNIELIKSKIEILIIKNPYIEYTPIK